MNIPLQNNNKWQGNIYTLTLENVMMKAELWNSYLQLIIVKDDFIPLGLLPSSTT